MVYYLLLSHFKVCLSIQPYSSGNDGKWKSSGIKKLLIICLAPKATESHGNLKEMFEMLDLNALCGIVDFTYAADLKLIMIILGILGNIT